MMFQRWSSQLLAILNILSFSIAINKSVYKIILNSKGYAQFLQYDLDIPPLNEFTLCAWVRVTSLESDQTIFSYISNDDKRILRVWLDSGGQQMQISLDHGRVLSSAKVQFTAGVWRDVCISYQADYAAWALYIDAQLQMCDGSSKVQGYEFPGEGRLIFGYGTSEKGSPTGLSGEIYGVSMILYSTIERNNTMINKFWKKNQNSRKTKTANRNKHGNNYIIIGDLQTDQAETMIPFSMDEEDDSLLSLLTAQQPRDDVTIFPKHPTFISTSNDDKHDLPFHDNFAFIDNDEDNHFKQIHKHATLKETRLFKKELTGSGTRDLPIVLEYETPPSVTASKFDYSVRNLGKSKNSAKHEDVITISDIVQPPPLENNPKVYGQWTSSKFASNVLNYLKNTNFNTFKKPKKVSVISGVKLSDSYPYPSEFSYDKIRLPANYKKNIQTKKNHYIKKRAVNNPEINVEIVKNDLNEYLQLLPKYPDPKLVEVTNRGEANRQLKNKLHKNGDKIKTFESKKTIDILPIIFENQQLNTKYRHRGNSLMDILPFLTSKDNIVKNQSNEMKTTETNQVYLKNFSNGNKWHNVKSYNNDYTPRLIKDLESLTNSAVKVANKRVVSFANRGSNKQVQVNDAERIKDGRVLAKEVSNQANENPFPISKFKHSLFSVHDHKPTTSNNIAVRVVDNDENDKTNTQSNFNKYVKLGNALNEQFITGFDELLIKKKFLGGDDTIADISKHRSSFYLDKKNRQSKQIDIPSSLGLRVCKNVELYVKGDESIGKSKILSPLQHRNIGIDFIFHSYKKCSMNEMSSKDKSLLLIDWVKTPVKLFGGAYPKKTKDLCGFF